MKEIQLSDFKKDMDTIIGSVIRSHKPILICDEGNSFVKLVPFLPTSSKKASWLGCMKDTGKITGDIVSTIEDEKNWEILS